MNADKKPEKDVPGMVVPETTVAGLPPEVMPSFPVPKVGPKDDIAPYVTPTQLAPVPSEHATIPPVASLGNGTIITLPVYVDLDTVEKISEGNPEGGSEDAARGAKRQLDRAKLAA